MFLTLFNIILKVFDFLMLFLFSCASAVGGAKRWSMG